MLTEQQRDSLIQKAQEIREIAYAPYSKFKVGCSILTEEGEYYQGCNIENVIFPVGICAERSAIANMVCNRKGQEIPKIVGICVSSSIGVRCCGVCLQAIEEFVPEGDVPIILLKVGEKESDNTFLITSFRKMMPMPISLKL